MSYKKFVCVLLLIIFKVTLWAADAATAGASSELARVAIASNDYVVTAGDVYTLYYRDSSVLITVDSTYQIRVGGYGIIDARNKKYITLKSQVENLVLKNNPMSGVQFVLSTPAVFKIYITGECKNCQELRINSLTRLSSIYEAYSTAFSSNRNVEVISCDNLSCHYDLFSASRNGKITENPYLRPNDTINFLRSGRVVNIKGAVERPGQYELLDGENLSDLIESYAHGLLSTADISRIEVTKQIDKNFKSGKKVYLDKIDNTYILDSYDSVYIPSFSSLKPVMFIEGAVKAESDSNLQTSNRITVRFENEMNYAQLVRNYGDYFTAVSDIDNAYIVRDGEILKFDIRRSLYDSSFYSDMQVKPNDVLIIPFRQFFVTVSGSVSSPGRYPYIPDRTYEYYIGLAGGFVKGKNSFGAVKITDINGKSVAKNAFIQPETNINAKTNSFTYYFNQYASIITTFLSLALSGLTLYFTVLSK